MTDIYMYGTIGEDWLDDGAMTSHRFAYLMQQAKDDVVLHINSGGGDVFEANTIAEVIRQYDKGNVTARIEGLAASAASYCALTADIVEIAPSALLMIHNPWGVCQGESVDMRKTADMLDAVKKTIVIQYMSKTGLTDKQIAKYMDNTTWFTADEAIELGFCDGYTEQDMKIAACVDKTCMSHFKNTPESLIISDDFKATFEQVAEPRTEPETDETEPAGDVTPTIADETQSQTDTEAVKVEAEAAAKVECINGMFLVK